METKQNSAGLKNRGVDLLLNYQIWGHITIEGKYMKIKTEN